jgi:hypothetical protein
MTSERFENAVYMQLKVSAGKKKSEGETKTNMQNSN